MKCSSNIEAARKLLEELKVAYQTLPSAYRQSVKETLIDTLNVGRSTVAS